MNGKIHRTVGCRSDSEVNLCFRVEWGSYGAMPGPTSINSVFIGHYRLHFSRKRIHSLPSFK